MGDHAGAPAGLVVAGAINVDLVVAADRLPGPGETVVGAGMQHHGGGKGANAAVAGARAGAAVRLIGAVGTDDTGDGALRDLEVEGVDVGGVARIADEATGVALIVVDRHGENQIAVGAGANAAVDPGWVQRQLSDAVAGAGCVLVSTEIAGDAVVSAVRGAARAGVVCVLNPAPPIPAVLEVLDQRPVMTPNVGELIALVELLDGRTVKRESASAPAARAQAAALAARLTEATASPVVVTLGADGALLVLPGRPPIHVPPGPAQVRDTTGAGDTFNGVLAAALATGAEIADAVRRATVAASLSVAHLGARAGMPRRAEIDEAVGAGRNVA
jgi:ribokinase